MSNRTVIQVLPADETKGFAAVVESFSGHKDQPQGALIECALKNGSTTSTHEGEAVYEIFQAVAAIKKELDFDPPQNKEPIPIYLDDRAVSAQKLPWEALRRSDKTFLALEELRPIGRIAGSTTRAIASSEPLYQPPFKVLAVISAAGVDGISEWKQLYGGLKANQPDTDFRLHTIVAEDSVSQAIDDANDPALTKEWLASDDPQVRRFDDMILGEIDSFKPHLIHFFCHGMPGERPQLELSKRSEKAANKPRGSVILDEDFFKTLARQAQNTWCILLNCCHGASREESCSLARRIVEIGFPVSIGMREAVEIHDAEVFCGEFYRILGRLLHDRFKNGENQQIIDWVSTLTEPRRRICKERVQSVAKAAEVREWTYPVIYVRNEPFNLRRAKPGLSEDALNPLLEEIETLLALRKDLAQADVPDSVLAGIDEKLAELTAQLQT